MGSEMCIRDRRVRSSGRVFVLSVSSLSSCSSIHPSIRLCVCLGVREHLSVCPRVRPSGRVFVHTRPSVLFFFHPSVYPSVCLSLASVTIRPSVRASVRPSVCLRPSVRRSARPSVQEGTVGRVDVQFF